MSAPNVHPHGELHNPDTAHETTDINMRAIVSFVIFLAGVTLAVQGAMYGVFVAFDRMEATSDPIVSPLATPAGQAPADPRLQTTPWADLKALRADEFSYLHGYGWIDKQAGVARIPIDRAKAMLLQKGLAVRPGPVDATEGTSIAATGESSGGRNLSAAGADKSTPSTGATGAQGAAGAQGAGSQPATPPKKPGGGYL